MCRRWRMAVDGPKTEILHSTNSHEDFTQIKLNGELAKPRNHSGSTSILNSTTNNTLKSQLPKLRETGISSENIAVQSGALPFRP